MDKDLKDMTEEEIRARIIELGFGGDLKLFDRFCGRLLSELPKGTGVAVRGSVLTAKRWEDGAPFDADGFGTSDIDVTLVGDRVMHYWDADAFYIPALHTKPLCDKDTSIAPGLNPFRESLQRMVGRPVNFQATSDFILFVRDVLLGQPYYMLIEAEEEGA